MSSKELRERYAPRFYDLLMRCMPRRPDLGVEVLSRKSEERATKRNISLEEAFRQIYEEAADRVRRREALMKDCSITKNVSSNKREIITHE